MRYIKPALRFSEQARLLTSRGLQVADEASLSHALQVVNYYRLSAYWYPFRNADDTLKSGTTFQCVWRRYTFDRQVRLLAMDAIERIEIAIRTLIVNCHVLKHGAYGYLEAASLPNLLPSEHEKLIKYIREATSKSREPFVEHFRSKYTFEIDLPLWIACELMAFGTIFTFYKGLENPLQKEVASSFKITDTVLLSWLKTLNALRNFCAHHSRVWNRVFGVKPLIPNRRKNPEWHSPVAIPNDRLFGVLTVLHFMLLNVAPQSRWKNRLVLLFAEYADIPVSTMGFPDEWETSPLWKSPASEFPSV